MWTPESITDSDWYPKIATVENAETQTNVNATVSGMYTFKHISYGPSKRTGLICLIRQA